MFYRPPEPLARRIPRVGTYDTAPDLKIAAFKHPDKLHDVN